MSGQRDGLLDALSDCRRIKAMCEASLVLAVDLLMEWHDGQLDETELTRLKAATRAFLLNTPVGGR